MIAPFGANVPFKTANPPSLKIGSLMDLIISDVL